MPHTDAIDRDAIDRDAIDLDAIDRAAILAEVVELARVLFGDPCLELTLDTTSDDVPAWDSLNHITLVVELECRFGIRFQMAEVEDLKTVGELVRLIELKLALAHA